MGTALLLKAGSKGWTARTVLPGVLPSMSSPTNDILHVISQRVLRPHPQLPHLNTRHPKAAGWLLQQEHSVFPSSLTPTSALTAMVQMVRDLQGNHNPEVPALT